MPLIFDKLVKAPLFGCQQCGQCLLSQTGYVCPMTCPKGLRNGPCGGTLDGACEVLPDQPCVWLNIRDRDYREHGVHRPIDDELIGTSSLRNYVTGRDKATRLQQSYHQRKANEQESVLARKFERIKPIITYEIASPRDRSGLRRVEQTVATLEQCVDAINTTTNAGGVPSLHSLETARHVVANGVAPIVQFCGRDQDAETFRQEARTALSDGFANILVLTGDWNPNTERGRHPELWFPMDSLQMVDILAAKSGFVKRPFVGVASTAYMTPMQASVDRFLTKLRAGANFTQTQMVTETQIFGEWLRRVRATLEGARCRVLASVPLIGKPRSYEVLRRLPGVFVDPGFAAALEANTDLEKGGLGAARHLIRELLKLEIDGLHLMNFGVPIEAVVDLVHEIRSLPASSAA